LCITCWDAVKIVVFIIIIVVFVVIVVAAAADVAVQSILRAYRCGFRLV